MSDELKKPIVSIVTVHCDTPDWIKLFVLSVRKFTADIDHEIVIVDNGSIPENKRWISEQPDVRVLGLPTIELFHAGGMDLGTRAAHGHYVCILDSDAHVQRPGWVQDLIALYHANEKTRLIGCVGPEHKPLHPPLFFFERDFILDNGIYWRYLPGPDKPHQTDTAQQAYWDILELGYEVLRLPKGPRVYAGERQDEIWFGDPPQASISHAWYGSRFQEWNPKRTKQMLDGITLEEHLARKAAYFAEPLVQEILREGGGNV